jgi:DNA-binding response OmpR family regulator
MKVLVAEDNPLTLGGLTEVLLAEGYHVLQAADGAAALELFQREAPDFVCLDIMMPGVNGYDVCRRMRADRPQTPIVFITAKSEEVDKVLGRCLATGEELGRRFGSATSHPPPPFQMGDLTVYPAELRARRGQDTIELSLRDVKVLELLHSHRGRVLDRNTIFNHCWGANYFPNSRSLDQHISQLRRRIELDPACPKIIRTVHGAGYRFES